MTILRSIFSACCLVIISLINITVHIIPHVNHVIILSLGHLTVDVMAVCPASDKGSVEGGLDPKDLSK
jgi:hypothetical protein